MITSGTILIGRDALRPQCFQLEDDSIPSGWTTMKHDLGFQDLEKELAAAGWTFFYLAGAIQATAFGADWGKVMQAALKRLITRAKQQKCNCLEIDSVKAGSFLGIRSVRIFAHPRHLQKGMVFAGR